MDPRKKKGVILQIIAYIVAIAVAIFVGYLCKDMDTLWQVLWADLAGTLVIFVFSQIFHNSSFYDPYWSVAPIIIVSFYLFYPLLETADPIRGWLVFALVQFWSWRLTINFLRGWKGIHQQDWRYDDLHAKTGKWFPFVDLFGIQIFPTMMVFASCLPLYWIYTSDLAFNALDVVAGIVTFIAILIELFADNQLNAFVKNKKEKGSTLTSGLWAYSRHPNYFGEMTFWWGIFLFGLAASPSNWMYYIAGAIIISCLFFFISVPMIDERMMKRRNNYQEIKDSISGIIPWFPKKRF